MDYLCLHNYTNSRRTCLFNILTNDIHLFNLKEQFFHVYTMNADPTWPRTFFPSISSMCSCTPSRHTFTWPRRCMREWWDWQRKSRRRLPSSSSSSNIASENKCYSKYSLCKKNDLTLNGIKRQTDAHDFISFLPLSCSQWKHIYYLQRKSKFSMYISMHKMAMCFQQAHSVL